MIVSIFLYAMFSAFFVGVFLIKYRIEYILAFPFISAMFAVYLWLAFRTGSIVQRPERLFRSRRVTLSVALTVAVLVFTTFIDMPSLKYFSTPSFLSQSASESEKMSRVVAPLDWDNIDLVVFDVTEPSTISDGFEPGCSLANAVACDPIAEPVRSADHSHVSAMQGGIAEQPG